MGDAVNFSGALLTGERHTALTYEPTNFDIVSASLKKCLNIKREPILLEVYIPIGK